MSENFKELSDQALDEAIAEQDRMLLSSPEFSGKSYVPQTDSAREAYELMHFRPTMEKYWRASRARFESTFLMDAHIENTILIMTCGMQPYSIALSLLSRPASHVLMVATEGSEKHAQRAIQLINEYLQPRVRTVVIEKEDSAAVYGEIQTFIQQSRSRSSNPINVVVDITSGTKAMTAAASAFAATEKAEQVYIASEPKSGWHFQEQLHRVEHPLTVFGDGLRAEANRAFNTGTYELAAQLYRELRDTGAPGYHYALRHELALAYAAYVKLDFVNAEVLFRTSAELAQKAQRSPFRSESLLEDKFQRRMLAQATICEHLQKATKNDSAETDPQCILALVGYLVSRSRRESKVAGDLAALLAYRAVELSLGFLLLQCGFTGEWTESLIDKYNRVCAKGHALQPGTRPPSKLGVAQRITLLHAYSDTPFETIKLPLHAIIGRLEQRNSSIYAHGFSLIDGKKLDDFLATATDIATLAWKKALVDAKDKFEFEDFHPVQIA